jgi:hypothetical protein
MIGLEQQLGGTERHNFILGHKSPEELHQIEQEFISQHVLTMH